MTNTTTTKAKRTPKAKPEISAAPAETETDTTATPAEEVQEVQEVQEVSHVPTVAILAALDYGYAAIRATHPDVPGSVAITLASGRGKSHGHFQGNAWRDTHEGAVKGARHELNMATESLSRGAVPTFATLLHEAVHALAHATGVKDTSRQGRYHGAKFRDLAEKVGLVCEDNPQIGTRTTGLQSWAVEHYADAIARLEEALTTYRAPEKGNDKEKTKSTVKVECGCGIPFSLSKRAWNIMGDTLSCDLCREEDGEGRFHEVSE